MKFLGIYPEHIETMLVLDDLRTAMTECGEYRRLDYDPASPTLREELLKAVNGVDVLLTGWSSPRLPDELLDNPQCTVRYICHLTGEMRRFISRRFIERGITVTNWGTGSLWAFAEGALALIFGCLKEMMHIRAHMQTPARNAYHFAHPRPTLWKKTVGFVGYGAIAGYLREMLRPFHCTVLVFDPYAERLPDDVCRVDTLPELFSRSEILTVQCGLTEQSRGMIGLEHFRLLPPHAVLINTARGAVLREQELITFLLERPDVIAGLDVYEHDPFPPDSPIPFMKNVLCYPHCVGTAGATFYEENARWAAANIRAFCHGGELHGLVTLDRYDRMT